MSADAPIHGMPPTAHRARLLLLSFRRLLSLPRFAGRLLLAAVAAARFADRKRSGSLRRVWCHICYRNISCKIRTDGCVGREADRSYNYARATPVQLADAFAEYYYLYPFPRRKDDCLFLVMFRAHLPLILLLLAQEVGINPLAPAAVVLDFLRDKGGEWERVAEGIAAVQEEDA